MWWTSFVVLSWPALSVSYVSMTSSGMQRGEQSGSRSATARLGVRDFEIHWISCGFRISEWISGFHSGFLNFSLDFCRQVSSCMFLDILVIVPSLAKIFS